MLLLHSLRTANANTKTYYLQLGSMYYLASASTSPSATATIGAKHTGIGLQRVPGVWTRRGRWAPANEISDEVANQAGAEGRRVGDKQRQRREDEVSTENKINKNNHPTCSTLSMPLCPYIQGLFLLNTNT